MGGVGASEVVRDCNLLAKAAHSRVTGTEKEIDTEHADLAAATSMQEPV